MTGKTWWRVGSVITGLGVLAVTTVGAPAVAVPTAGQTNAEFAGYDVQKATGHISSVSEKFVVPKITCKKDFSGVGPAIVLNSVVHRKSNSFTVAEVGVGAGCESKTPTYDAIVQVDGVAHNDFHVSAGDHITVSIVAKKHKTIATLVDGKQTSRYPGAKMVGASTFLGATSIAVSKKNVKLDPFTPIKVSRAKVNGKSLASQHATKLTWVNGKTVLVKPSKLAKGGEFVLRFVNSN
jgi:hypothetical protein